MPDLKLKVVKPKAVVRTVEGYEFDLEVVRGLGELNCSRREIAAVLGVSRRTIDDRMKNDSEFREAFERGREEGNRALRKRLYDLAMGGHAAALIFLAKNRLGMGDRPAVESEERPQVVFHFVDNGRGPPPVSGS